MDCFKQLPKFRDMKPRWAIKPHQTDIKLIKIKTIQYKYKTV